SPEARDRAVAVLEGCRHGERRHELPLAQRPRPPASLSRTRIGHRRPHDQHEEHANGRSHGKPPKSAHRKTQISVKTHPAEEVLVLAKLHEQGFGSRGLRPTRATTG